MDTKVFERLLKVYVDAANNGDNDDEIDAAWNVIQEAAGLLGVPIPVGAE